MYDNAGSRQDKNTLKATKRRIAEYSTIIILKGL
jgi:hypothetical protein